MFSARGSRWDCVPQLQCRVRSAYPARPKSYHTSYFLFDMLKVLLLLKASFKAVLLLGYLIERAHKLTVTWNMRSLEPHKGVLCKENWFFLLVSWQRHSCYLVDNIHKNIASILPFYSQELNLLRQIPWPYFSLWWNQLSEESELLCEEHKRLLLCRCPTQWCQQCFLALQVVGLCFYPWCCWFQAYWTPLQHESKMWSALCCLRDWEKCIGSVSCSIISA